MTSTMIKQKILQTIVCLLTLLSFGESFLTTTPAPASSSSRSRRPTTLSNAAKPSLFVKKPLFVRSSISSSSSSLQSTTTSATTTTQTPEEPEDEYDVIIVGSGIGGLSAGAMLTKYGYKVGIFESHYTPGGCAHGYTIKDPKMGNEDNEFVFDTGPSFFSGINPKLPSKSSNPLRSVLDASK